jgi:putative transposase
MALARRRPEAGLLHPSGRGSPSTLEASLAVLQPHGLLLSMSRTANCYATAVNESFFHSFKGECIERGSFQSRAHARKRTFESIETF